jgi:hypothetical protein
MYEFLIDKVDRVLKKTYSDHNIEISDKDRRIEALNITFDFLGEWYSDRFKNSNLWI